MITVATFTKPEEAHLLRMRLEAVGIAAFVQDEHFVQTYGLYSNVIGGVRVQVEDEDAAAAREFMGQDAGVPADDPAEEHCPRCGSTAVETEHYSKRAGMLGLLLLPFPLIIPRARARCVTCLHTWKRAG